MSVDIWYINCHFFIDDGYNVFRRIDYTKYNNIP